MSSIGDKIVWGTFAAIIGVAMLTLLLALVIGVHPLFWMLALLVAGVGIYLLPVIIGAYRGVESIVSLAVVNVFLGWSLLGWVVSLAWACAPIRRGPTPPPISREITPH